MATVISRSQISRKYSTGFQLATNFTTTSGISNTVTAVFGVLCTTDNVPVQVGNTVLSSETLGYVLNQKIRIWDAVSKSAIKDSLGNEIYGKITKPSSDFLLNYFSLVDGVETTYSIAAGLGIDFAPIYVYNDLNLPIDSATRVDAVEVGQDPAKRATTFSELLTISAINTLSNLTKTPVVGEEVKLIINGIDYSTIDGSLSVSSKTITWLFTSSNNGFDISTSGYTVKAEYKVNA
jgi:hypothetical protein